MGRDPKNLVFQFVPISENQCNKWAKCYFKNVIFFFFPWYPWFFAFRSYKKERKTNENVKKNVFAKFRSFCFAKISHIFSQNSASFSLPFASFRNIHFRENICKIGKKFLCSFTRNPNYYGCLRPPSSLCFLTISRDYVYYSGSDSV